jgi:hypothetical protein
MDASKAPIIGTILQIIEEHSLTYLPKFLYHVGRDLVLPVLVALFALGGLATFGFQLWRIIVPCSASERYLAAKNLYRRGKRREALNGWAELKNFGPAYLSLATHALYVEHDPLKALGFIRKAKEHKVRINITQVNIIRMDAKALEIGGNLAMVEMNARMAKEDHLGVASR